MRKLLAALCLFAALSPALAQDAPVETVNAYGHSLVGVWHGRRADSIVKNMQCGRSFRCDRQ